MSVHVAYAAKTRGVRVQWWGCRHRGERCAEAGSGCAADAVRVYADGYDTWMDLVAKHPKKDADGKEKDPGASLMDMMKDMYDNGDDNLRKTLGEAMLKSRQKQEMGDAAGDIDKDLDMEH